MSTSTPLKFPPILEDIRKAIPEGQPVYLVGGAVRDALLNRPIRDLDFVVERDGIKLARRVANSLKADFFALDPERDTGRVIATGADGKRMILDFASFRGPDLEADILGRDFTVNAIAYDLNDNSLYDPTGGGKDLIEKQLRACSPSAFTDDPVRILRGIRLAASFSFTIQAETRQGMKEAVSRLVNVSPERLRDELFRILDGPLPATCVRALDMLGALDKVLPELTALKGVEQFPPHVHDVWEHTLSVAAHLETILTALSAEYNPESAGDLINARLVMGIGRYRKQISENLALTLTADRSMRSLLFLAALYHDAAKPLTMMRDEEGQLRFWDHDQQGAGLAAGRARSLAMSNDEIQHLETIIRNHMRVLFHTNRLVTNRVPPSRRAIYRFFRDTGACGVEVCLLALADMRATYEQTLPEDTWAACLEVVRTLMENWYERPAEAVTPPQLLDGNDLMRELELQPGKQIGELLETIREAQAMGEVATREQALLLAKKRILQGPFQNIRKGS